MCTGGFGPLRPSPTPFWRSCSRPDSGGRRASTGAGARFDVGKSLGDRWRWDLGFQSRVAMGALANYPLALAPGMGLNAYFTYTVVKGMGVSWQTALGAVFLEPFAQPRLQLFRRHIPEARVGLGAREIEPAGPGT